MNWNGHKLTTAFSENKLYINPAYNDHYVQNPANLQEIGRMAAIDNAFKVLFNENPDPTTLAFAEARETLRVREIEAQIKLPEKRQELIDNGVELRYKAGEAVPSPWGKNSVDSFVSKEENGVEDICIKTIVVNEHRQLSLQKHRGREEIWEVVDGTLTVNLNDKVYRVSAEGVFDITNEEDLVNGKGIAMELDGENFGTSEDGNNYIYLPKGSVHAMNNVHDVPVTVRETQKGLTWEADNDRLVEALEDKKEPRATIPLISEMEVTAAKNFRRIEDANNPYWDNGLRFAQKAAAEAKSAPAAAVK